MTEESESSILLIGLSGTGKTNFLVALDIVLDYKSHPEALVHARPAEDRSYLQPLREKWLRGEELEHTSRMQTPPPHHLHLLHEKTKLMSNFHLPDLAGETFQSHFETRTFPKELNERLQSATGILLFVHCDQVANHEVLEAPALFDTVESEQTTVSEIKKDASEPQNEIPSQPNWRLEDACQQAKLVDLMQFVEQVRHERPNIRVAVIISAWDLVDAADNLGLNAAKDFPKDPAAFFAKHWPLLDQFLVCHAGEFDYRVFGVSARGGGKTAEDIKRLTEEFDRPVERVLVVSGTDRSNDLTKPIRWLLGIPDEAQSL